MTYAYRILLVLLLTGYMLALGPDPASAVAPVMPDFTPLDSIVNRHVDARDVAVDAEGRLYIADGYGRRVVVFTPSGRLLRSFRVNDPDSLAVAADGTVYVSSVRDGSVTAYKTDGTSVNIVAAVTGNVHHHPRDIQVDANGRLYVADPVNNTVTVYAADGTEVLSVGTAGVAGSAQADGVLWHPHGLALNEAAAEIIVLDRQQIYDRNVRRWVDGVRLQVFTMDGTFLRGYSLHGYDYKSGKMTKPYNVAVDGAGRIYVTDRRNNTVMVYAEDSAAAALNFLGEIDNSGRQQLRQPRGMAISANNILYVAARFYSGDKKYFGVQAFGLDSFSAAVVTPSPLEYKAIESGNNPTAQTVTIVNNGTTDLTWTASAADAWITLAATSGTVAGGAASAPLDITVDIAGMQPGQYTGLVAFSLSNGTKDQVNVALDVEPNPLTVDPAVMTLNSQVGSTPTVQKINVTSTGDGLAWTASADASWITLSTTSGTTPAVLDLSVDVTGMAAGTYSGVVTFAQTGDNPCPVTMAVELILDPDTTVVDETPTLGGLDPNGQLIQGSYWRADRLSVPDGLNLNGVWGRNDEHVVIVGDNGYAVRLNNGLEEPVDTKGTKSLRSVWGAGKNTFYAVGVQDTLGAVLKCRDGECEQVCAVGEELADIYGIMEIRKVTKVKKGKKGKKGKKVKKKSKKVYEILAVGTSGGVLNTAACATGTGLGSDLRSLWGDKADNLYAVGAAGQIYHYDGTAWNDESVPSAGDYNGVWGRNRNDMFIVGNGGAIYHNDGSGWTAMTSGTDVNLYGVWGSETGEVYAVGAKGTVLLYADDQWTTVMTGGTDIVLNDVWVSKGNTVVAVGDNGTVLMGIGQ